MTSTLGKPPIIAEKRAGGVEVWREGDEVHSLYTPDIPGYYRWLALAEQQAQQK